MVNTIAFAVDDELMEMFVIPAHGDLDDVVQVGNSALTLDQKPSPDHGADTLKDDFELIDDWGRRRLHCPILKHFPYFFSLSLILDQSGGQLRATDQ